MAPPCCETCCDNLKWKCREANWGDKRNLLAAAIAGTLFFSGWWIMFDLAAQAPSRKHFDPIYYICGAGSSVAVAMINIVSRSHVTGGGVFTGGVVGPCGAMVWLFLGFCLAFASLIAAGWILFVVYVINNSKHKVYGLLIFLQNLCIFMSGMIYKFGRSEDLWGVE